MAADEVHEGRQYISLECHFCNLPAAAWLVYESEFSWEPMYVCEKHKYTAFS